MVNELEIIKINKKYNFKCKVFFNTIHITSKYDEWVAEVRGENRIILKHVNQGVGKHRMHEQRVFKDLPFMFESIESHDGFKESKSVEIPLLRTN